MVLSGVVLVRGERVGVERIQHGAKTDPARHGAADFDWCENGRTELIFSTVFVIVSEQLPTCQRLEVKPPA